MVPPGFSRKEVLGQAVLVLMVTSALANGTGAGLLFGPVLVYVLAQAGGLPEMTSVAS
jgi:hypothetical protein